MYGFIETRRVVLNSPFYKPSAIPQEKLHHCVNFGDTHGPETKYQIFFGLRAERCIILYPVNSCSYSIYQVAQFILDDCIGKGKGSSCRIVCTQPRRISAISVCYFFVGLLFDYNMYTLPFELFSINMTTVVNVIVLS